MWNTGFKKVVSFVVALALLSTSMGPVSAQTLSGAVAMPDPGIMTGLSEAFTPAHLVGLTIDPQNAFQFDFIIHKGDLTLSKDQKRDEYKELVKYFLAALTVPDDAQWVNLSPYESNRIIDNNFGLTEMGRDLLAQDYILKQLTASLIHPDNEIGKKFWARVYEEAWRKFGTTDIPVDTFNKVWILPDKAVVYEQGRSALIVESHLKVMLESDYEALHRRAEPDGTEAVAPQAGREANAAGEPGLAQDLSKQIAREVLLPVIEAEVNNGKNFANLRQIVGAMILATWYKKTLRESLLGRVYADKGKVKGIDQDPRNNQAIYDKYVAAFKKGVFNLIREDVDRYSQELIPRRYFSGGVIHPEVTYTQDLAPVESLQRDAALNQDLEAATVSVDPAQQTEVGNNPISQNVPEDKANEKDIRDPWTSPAAVLGETYSPKHLAGLYFDNLRSLPEIGELMDVIKRGDRISEELMTRIADQLIRQSRDALHRSFGALAHPPLTRRVLEAYLPEKEKDIDRLGRDFDAKTDEEKFVLLREADIIGSPEGWTHHIQQVNETRLREEERRLDRLADIMHQESKSISDRLTFATVMAAFLGEQAIRNGPHENVYIARDMGLGYTIERVLRELRGDQALPQVIYLSRATLTFPYYAVIGAKITEVVKRVRGLMRRYGPGKAAEFDKMLMKELERDIPESSNEVNIAYDQTRSETMYPPQESYLDAIDSIRGMLISLGAPQSNKRRFIDTGWGRFPKLLQAVSKTAYGRRKPMMETDGLVLQRSEELIGFLQQISPDMWDANIRRMIESDERYQQHLKPNARLMEEVKSFLPQPFVFDEKNRTIIPNAPGVQAASMWVQALFVVGAARYYALAQGVIQDLTLQGMDKPQALDLLGVFLNDLLGIEEKIDAVSGETIREMNPYTQFLPAEIATPENLLAAAENRIRHRALQFRGFSPGVRQVLLDFARAKNVVAENIAPDPSAAKVREYIKGVLDKMSKRERSKLDPVKIIEAVKDLRERLPDSGLELRQRIFNLEPNSPVFRNLFLGIALVLMILTSDRVPQRTTRTTPTVPQQNVAAVEGPFLKLGDRGNPLIKKVINDIFELMDVEAGIRNLAGRVNPLTGKKYSLVFEEEAARSARAAKFSANALVFDIDVQTVVVAFQNRYQINEDGIVGPKTFGKLKELGKDYAMNVSRRGFIVSAVMVVSFLTDIVAGAVGGTGTVNADETKWLGTGVGARKAWPINTADRDALEIVEKISDKTKPTKEVIQALFAVSSENYSSIYARHLRALMERWDENDSECRTDVFDIIVDNLHNGKASQKLLANSLMGELENPLPLAIRRQIAEAVKRNELIPPDKAFDYTRTVLFDEPTSLQKWFEGVGRTEQEFFEKFSRSGFFTSEADYRNNRADLLAAAVRVYKEGSQAGDGYKQKLTTGPIEQRTAYVIVNYLAALLLQQERMEADFPGKGLAMNYRQLNALGAKILARTYLSEEEDSDSEFLFGTGMARKKNFNFQKFYLVLMHELPHNFHANWARNAGRDLFSEGSLYQRLGFDANGALTLLAMTEFLSDAMASYTVLWYDLLEGGGSQMTVDDIRSVNKKMREMTGSVRLKVLGEVFDNSSPAFRPVLPYGFQDFGVFMARFVFNFIKQVRHLVFPWTIKEQHIMARGFFKSLVDDESAGQLLPKWIEKGHDIILQLAAESKNEGFTETQPLKYSWNNFKGDIKAVDFAQAGSMNQEEDSNASPRAIPGGIDLNQSHMDLQIRRDGNGVPLPVGQQDLEHIRINGLVPTILDIRPVTALPILSEVRESPAFLSSS